MTDDREPGRASPLGIGLVALAFAAIAILAGGDLALDLAGGTSISHALVEGLVVITAAAGVAFMLRALRAARRRSHQLVRGLAEAIDRQLERWQLTGAEREVALLLLKGLSHREIAGVRGVGEPTVRQQAQSIYRKAGVAGRSDLAAFFLEDLLPPMDLTSAGGRPA